MQGILKINETNGNFSVNALTVIQVSNEDIWKK